MFDEQNCTVSLGDSRYISSYAHGAVRWILANHCPPVTAQILNRVNGNLN